MLAIPMQIPIKKMAIYGSTALLVGFASTLVLLREFVPKDSTQGVSYVQPEIVATTSTDAEAVVKVDDPNQSKESATAIPSQADLLIQGGPGVATPSVSRSSTTPVFTPQPNSNSNTSTPGVVTPEYVSNPVTSNPVLPPAPTTVPSMLSPVQVTLDTVTITNPVSVVGAE